MLSLFRYIHLAQRAGMSRTTAYGAYRKAGGTISPTMFGRLWSFVRSNPFAWNRL